MDPLSMSASLITIGALAIQTISIIQKTQELCASIRDTPRNLQLLLEELQLLSTLLSGFKNNVSQPLSQGFPDALEHCKHALRSIQAFSKDLEKTIGSSKHSLRHWASFKMIFTEKKMKSHLNRLERAKSMLSLAHQCCMQSQIMDVIQLQQQLLRNPTEHASATLNSGFQRCRSNDLYTRILETSPMTGSELHNTSNEQYQLASLREISHYNLILGVLSIKRRKSRPTNPLQDNKWVETQTTELNFQPRFLQCFQHGFSILCEYSYGAWQYSLRSFSIFNTEHSIYYLCAAGDVKGAKQLCHEGQASPFSVTIDGFTLLHVAAAFGHAEFCQWLLDVGVDANVAASSRWSTTGHPIEYMQYEAGSTPLHTAVKCAGSIGIPGPDKPDFDGLQNDDKIRQSAPERTSTNYLNTLRVLVENGADPMITNNHGDTVLHVHTGAVEQFHYLLQQEASVIETSQPNYNGDTIAERHARWYWREGPKRTTLAWESEKNLERQFYHPRCNRPNVFPITSKTLLLHETNGHLRHFIRQNNGDFESAVELLYKLVAEGVDVHGILDEESEDRKTPLAQIPRIIGEVDTSEEGLERETKITSFAILTWLRVLEDARGDLRSYAEKEEGLIRSLSVEESWKLYEYDGEKEYRVDWAFDMGSNVLSCSISAQYVFRRIPDRPAEVQDDETHNRNLPGAWPEEAP